MIRAFGLRATGQAAEPQIFLMVVPPKTLRDVRGHRANHPQKLALSSGLPFGGKVFAKLGHLIPELPARFGAVQLFETF